MGKLPFRVEAVLPEVSISQPTIQGSDHLVHSLSISSLGSLRRGKKLLPTKAIESLTAIRGIASSLLLHGSLLSTLDLPSCPSSRVPVPLISVSSLSEAHACRMRAHTFLSAIVLPSGRCLQR